MTRMLSTAVAATLAVLPVAVTAAPSGYYVATPAATPVRTSFITNEMMWKWSETAYVADESTHRDLVTCQMIAHSAGKLSAFSVKGTTFDADALAKCNARAR